MKKDWIKQDFIEELSNLEHEQWMSWSKHIRANNVIPLDLLRRWEKNWIPYSKLDEKTKEFDRVWARKVVKLIDNKIKRLEKMYKTLDNMAKAVLKISKENYVIPCEGEK